MPALYKYKGPSTQDRQIIIDDNTKLWMARMIVGEGGKDCSEDKTSAMLWATMNRWMLWPGRRYYKTYLDLIRAFSQPINPRWQFGGDLAHKYANKDAGSLARLKRRQYICNLTLENIKKKSPQIYKAVNEFQEGKLLLPDIITNLHKPKISNWASLPSTPKKYPFGCDIDGDWFFQDKNLISGEVVVEII